MDKLENEIVNLLRDLKEETPANADMDLLKTGYMDSFDIAGIVAAMEEHFHIEMGPEDIVPENFNTVAHMAALVAKIRE